ncbi:MAG: hypothetical protein WC765_05235 [Phycisphaerae bacterium]|jgi:hypothetical protein|nr:MAG: hypothetical protein A2Y13_05720 [Planctomycetes bacterium GWC2_45_44]HBG78251.1 hypothetical protein [Phycisphaerales bacterium]HBR18802.1 hypothetical protein [Phycisphaerales bacterium]
MSVIAPYCQYKKTNFKLGMLILLVAAVWFAYDGYKSEAFIKRHTKDGKPDSTLTFHRKSPPFFAGGAVAIGIIFAMVKGKKIVADEQELILSDGGKIAYNSIETVNKTEYQSKGFFTVEYKSQAGEKKICKISSRDFDNLDAVLEILVAKITG